MPEIEGARSSLLPSRFRLDDAQLSAALCFADLQPTGISPLPHRPRATSYDEAVLQGADLLANGGAGLTAPADAALRIAASPARLLSVLTHRPGALEWTEVTFLSGLGRGPFVAFGKSDDGFDFTHLPLRAQVSVMIDNMLGLTALPSSPGGTPMTLDLSGYAAILATADLVQARRLEARLSRRGLEPADTVTAGELEARFAEGLEGQDTRWVVTAAARASPTDLAPTSGSLAAGLSTMEELGLAAPAHDGSVLTAAGHRLTTSLGQMLTFGAMTSSIVRGDQPFAMAHVTVFRALPNSWFACWTSIAPGDESIDLCEVSPTAALRFVGSLVDYQPADEVELAETSLSDVDTFDDVGSPAPEPLVCGNPECGVPLEPDANFCMACGKAVESLALDTDDITIDCPGCGMSIDSAASFCPYCGEQVT